MTYNIWFDVCAIFIVAIVLVTFQIKYNIPVIQYQLLRILAWTVMFSTTMDLLAGIWGNNITEAIEIFPSSVLVIIHVIYFAARNASPGAFLIYVLSVLNIREKTDKGIMILLIPMMIMEVLTFSSPVTKLLFYVDSAGVYHRGPLVYVCYIVAAAYLLFAFAMIVAFHKLITKPQALTFILFEFIAGITLAMQGMWPEFLVEGFGTALGLLTCLLAIQKPEEVLDGATGFLNKKEFSNVCVANLKQNVPFTVLLIVIDDYNFLEKSYGIDVMEHLMAEVAGYLRHFSGMTPFKISEEKFCLVGKNKDIQELEKVIGAIDERFLMSWKVSEYSIALDTCCCMIHCPSEVKDFQELMELIDTVARLEKEEKRRIVHFKELDVDQVRRYHKIELLVKEAVERDLLSVVYQPIYSAEKQCFSAAEALVRMHDPVMGNISPGEFIPIAEKNGAIVKIGKYVLDTVCQFIAKNDLKKYGIDYIEMNVSPVECLQEDMVECVMKPIDNYGLNPSQINLEITETAISSLPDSIDEKINQLLKKGVTFSLDDYGTGYSNLSRLAALPLEIIKIDKSIVQEAFSSERVKVILDSTLRMIAMLNKKVLAEGVEEKEQAEYLIEHGCDYIQGYYYAKPLSGTEFIQILEEQEKTE